MEDPKNVSLRVYRFWPGMGLLVSVVVLVAAGCSDNGLVPVEGILTLDGKPLSGATVYFVPEGTANQSAWATARGAECSPLG